MKGDDKGFWGITPRTYSVHLEAWRQRQKREYNNLITLAYLSVAFDRSKQLKSLDEYLIPDREPTEEEKLMKFTDSLMSMKNQFLLQKQMVQEEMALIEGEDIDDDGGAI